MGAKRKVSDEQLLRFLSCFINKHEHAPTFQEIADGVGFSSKSAVSVRLSKLKDRGLIDYQPRNFRTLRICVQRGNNG